MKRVVLFLIVALLCATITWVDTAARDTPWGVYPDRDNGDDHPWGGEQLRPDDGPDQNSTTGGTTTRFYLADLLTRFVIDIVIDWHSSNYRPYTGGTSTTNTGSTNDTQPAQSSTNNQGQ